MARRNATREPSSRRESPLWIGSGQCVHARKGIFHRTLRTRADAKAEALLYLDSDIGTDAAKLHFYGAKPVFDPVVPACRGEGQDSHLQDRHGGLSMHDPQDCHRKAEALATLAEMFPEDAERYRAKEEHWRRLEMESRASEPAGTGANATRETTSP
jgi:hypothetical protein